MGKHDLTVNKHLTIAIRYITYALNNLEEKKQDGVKAYLWVVDKHLRAARKHLVVDGERASWTYKDYNTQSTNDYLVYVLGAVNECLKDSSTDNYIDIQLAMAQGLVKVVEDRCPKGKGKPKKTHGAGLVK